MQQTERVCEMTDVDFSRFTVCTSTKKLFGAPDGALDGQHFFMIDSP